MYKNSYNGNEKGNEKKKMNCYDCKKVLAKYHKILEEAEGLFNASNNIVEREVIGAIFTAIKSLEKSFKFNEKANEMICDADEFLNKTKCNKLCKKDSCKCEEIMEKANKKFNMENALLCEALDLLKEALENIKKASYIRKDAYEIMDDYKKCVHNFHNKKDKKDDKDDDDCYKDNDWHKKDKDDKDDDCCKDDDWYDNDKDDDDCYKDNDWHKKDKDGKDDDCYEKDNWYDNDKDDNCDKDDDDKNYWLDMYKCCNNKKDNDKKDKPWTNGKYYK